MYPRKLDKKQVKMRIAKPMIISPRAMAVSSSLTMGVVVDGFAFRVVMMIPIVTRRIETS